MKDLCGRFYFAKDMNGDFMFTISDVWLMIKFAWLLPAKIAMTMIESSPQLVTFLESNCTTGDSWGAGIFSLIAWFAAMVMFIVILDSLNGPPASLPAPPTSF
jgi:hypothetical protein